MTNKDIVEHIKLRERLLALDKTIEEAAKAIILEYVEDLPGTMYREAGAGVRDLSPFLNRATMVLGVMNDTLSVKLPSGDYLPINEVAIKAHLD